MQQQWAQIAAEFALAAQRADYQTMARIRFSQALMLFVAGEDFFQMRREAAGYSLWHMAQVLTDPRDRVVVSGSGDGCPACRRLDRSSWTVNEALAAMPIPCPECTHEQKLRSGGSRPGWCRCLWGADPAMFR